MIRTRGAASIEWIVLTGLVVVGTLGAWSQFKRTTNAALATEGRCVAGAIFGDGVSCGAPGGPGLCFVAGTPVWTDRGLVPIEQIRAADRVLSTDEATGRTDYKPVLATFSRGADQTVRLTIAGEELEEIESTPEHRFAAVSGWLRAAELAPGTPLLRGIVTASTTGNLSARTYNLEVADWHTYYVGRSGILVHNEYETDPCDIISVDRELGERYRREAEHTNDPITDWSIYWCGDDKPCTSQKANRNYNIARAAVLRQRGCTGDDVADDGPDATRGWGWKNILCYWALNVPRYVSCLPPGFPGKPPTFPPIPGGPPGPPPRCNIPLFDPNHRYCG